MPTTTLKLLFALAAIALVLSLWWWQRGDDTVPLPVELQPVANEATSPTLSPANTSTPEPERSAAVDATAPPPKAAATATFDILVVDAATQQPVADAEACWSDAATREQVKQLPKEQAREFWDSAERMAQQFGRQARSDRDGRLRVVGDKDGCHVFARAGDRYGELVLSAYGEQPEGGHRLLLRREENLRVRVLDAAGQPAPRARVGLSFGSEASSAANPSYDSYAATDAAGVATFAHLQQLRSSHSGPSASHATTGCAVGIAIPGLPATPVVVAPSQPLPTEPIELRLPPTGSLRVRCTVAGAPMHGLDRVRVYGASKSDSGDHNRGIEERVDDDGWAWFRWLPADVPLLAKPWGPNVPFLDSKEVPALAVGEVRELRIDFASEALVLRGRVLDLGGVPMANAGFALNYGINGGGGSVGLLTDDRGVFLHVWGKPKGDKETWPLNYFQLMPLGRQELALALPPRELHAGINELGDLHFGAEPLVCAGRLDGFERNRSGAWLVLEREEADRSTGAVRWRSLVQPKVGLGEDGVFMARGRVEPGRYRLRITAREYLPVAPIEFALGQGDLLVPMRSAAALQVECLLPADTDVSFLAVDLAGGPARSWIPEDEERNGLPADNRRACVFARKPAVATCQWSAVEPGSYTLRVTLRGSAEPLLEVADVVVPLPAGGDPRLQPLDLRASLRHVDLKLLDARGQDLSRIATVFLQPQVDPQRWFGARVSGRPAKLLLPLRAQSIVVASDGCRPTTVVVPADVVEFTVRVEPWPRAEITLADPTVLPEGTQLTIYAEPAASRRTGSYEFPSGGSRQSGGLDALFRPDGSTTVLRRDAPVGSVVVGDDGPSALLVYLQRADRYQRLGRCAPSEVVAGAPVTIRLDADEVTGAAAELAAKPK
jgi:hypothetical protein